MRNMNVPMARFSTHRSKGIIIMKQVLSALLLLLATGIARAQWVPVTGRIIVTTEAIASDGTVNAKWTTTSRYSRSSSGSVLIQRIGRSGLPAVATMMDYGKSGKAYSVTYSTGQVSDMHRPLDSQYGSHPPTGMSPASQKISLGNDKVDGVDCFMMPLYDTGPNRSRVLIGKAWMAPAYNNLIMREEMTRVLPDGGKRHVVREFKMKDQKEPDAKLFARDRATVKAQWKPIRPTN
jgi:hypothetical protein